MFEKKVVFVYESFILGGIYVKADILYSGGWLSNNEQFYINSLLYYLYKSEGSIQIININQFFIFLIVTMIGAHIMRNMKRMASIPTVPSFGFSQANLRWTYKYIQIQVDKQPICIPGL